MSVLLRTGTARTPHEPATVDRLLTIAIRLTAFLLMLTLIGLAAYWYQLHYVHQSVSLTDRDALILQDQISQRPNDPELRVAMANLYLEKALYDEAVFQAEQVLRISRDNQGALLALGEAHERKGDLSQAATSFSRIVALNEGNPMAMSNRRLALAYQALAGISLTQGNAADAEAESRRSLEIDRGNADTLRLLGNAEAAQGKLDEAIQSYYQAVRYSPDFRDAYVDMEQAYSSKGDANRAGYAGGMVALADGDYSTALDRLSMAANAVPDAPEVHLGLAMTFEKQGQRSLALDEYRKAAQLDGSSIAAKQGLGRLDGR